MLYITGIGLGGLMLSSFVVIQQHFDKKRGFATGVPILGKSLGTLSYTPIFRSIVNKIGWRGAMVINACFAAQAVVFGALYTENNDEVICSPDVVVPVSIVPDVTQVDGICTVPCVPPAKKKTEDTKKKGSMDVIKSRTFIFYLSGVVLSCFGLYIMMKQTPSRALVQGMDSMNAALLLTALAGASALTRLITCVVVDLPWINRGLLLSLSTIIGGIIMTLTTLTSHDLTASYLISAAYGATLGYSYNTQHI